MKQANRYAPGCGKCLGYFDNNHRATYMQQANVAHNPEN
jgi:hypothetical protein